MQTQILNQNTIFFIERHVYKHCSSATCKNASFPLPWKITK